MASIAPEPEPKPERRRIIVGVDTHKHAHAAVAVDEPRSRLGGCHVQANRGGYAQLKAGRCRWAARRRSGSWGPAATAWGWRAGCVAAATAWSR